MAILSKGTTFATGNQVTAANLNALVDSATFASGAVDNTTTALDSSSPQKIIVKDSGISTSKLADSSSKTTGVTFAKMQHISTAKVLGRASAGEGDVEEAFDFKDEDNMSSDSATALASQQSIKAYVDASSTDGFTPTATATDTKSVTLPNGLIMKFGRASAAASTTTTVNFSDFGGNFTNDVFSVVLTSEKDSSTSSNPVRLNAQPTTSSFVIRNLLGSTVNVDFIAIGR